MLQTLNYIVQRHQLHMLSGHSDSWLDSIIKDSRPVDILLPPSVDECLFKRLCLYFQHIDLNLT